MEQGSAALRRGGRPRQGQPVIDRAFAVLAAFSASHRRLTLRQLSRRAGLPEPTAHRLVSRLTALGALERDEAGRYVVGVRLLEIASLAPRGHGLRQVALPYMGDLFEVTRQHVLLAILEGDQAVLVERLSPRGGPTVPYRVGGRLPLHSTAVGLTLLCHADHATRERVLSGDLVYEPEGTPVSPGAVRAQLAEVRRSGLSTIRRPDLKPALFSVAAPLYDADRHVVAALSTACPIGALDPQAAGHLVRVTARAVSRALARDGR